MASAPGRRPPPHCLCPRDVIPNPKMRLPASGRNHREETPPAQPLTLCLAPSPLSHEFSWATCGVVNSGQFLGACCPQMPYWFLFFTVVPKVVKMVSMEVQKLPFKGGGPLKRSFVLLFPCRGIVFLPIIPSLFFVFFSFLLSLCNLSCSQPFSNLFWFSIVSPPIFAVIIDPSSHPLKLLTPSFND